MNPVGTLSRVSCERSDGIRRIYDEWSVRVLQVVGRMGRGGAETMLMNLYRFIDRSKVQFDFLVHTNEQCDYDGEIRKLGGNIYHMPRYAGKNHLLYIKNCGKIS